jgi:hypothetical protein
MNQQTSHDHEHGGQEHKHDKVFHIIVNLEPMEVRQELLTFDDICLLAFPQGPFGEAIRYTVTCTKRGGDTSMVKGDSIKVEEGMICNVGNTDRS